MLIAHRIANLRAHRSVPILGDQADSGARESRNGQRKKVSEDKSRANGEASGNKVSAE